MVLSKVGNRLERLLGTQKAYWNFGTTETVAAGFHHTQPSLVETKIGGSERYFLLFLLVFLVNIIVTCKRNKT